MSIVSSAVKEMEEAGFGANEIAAMRHILLTFFKHWDSGGAVWAMVPVFERLIRGLPLSPLTGSDDEWIDVRQYSENPAWQNCRCSHVFKNADGKAWDVENLAWDGTFPYEPQPSANHLDPVIEFQTERAN